MLYKSVTFLDFISGEKRQFLREKGGTALRM